MASLNLSPSTTSFAFTPKSITVRHDKVVLGSEAAEAGKVLPGKRVASLNNGWFPPKMGAGGSPISPLPLSASHAQVWFDGGKIYIQDLDSPFGTFVNNTRIKAPTALKHGDVISLGSAIARNTNTPDYITDDHLKAIVARVTIS